MLRSILGVIVGYLVMGIFVAGLFIGLWFALGLDGVLQAGTYEGTMTLHVSAVLISILGALLGGWLCRKIAGNTKAVMVMAGIVLVLGLLMAVMTMMTPDPGVRAPGESTLEALSKGKDPLWAAFLNPFIGAIGVLAGGGALGALKKKA